MKLPRHSLVIFRCTLPSFKLNTDIHRDLTRDELQQIEKLAQKILSQTVNLAQAMSELQANDRLIANKLKVLQDGQDAQGSEQRALGVTLASHHEAVRRSQKAHEKSLKSVERAQSNAVSVQRQVLSVTTKTRKQTARMSRDMLSHHRATFEQHEKTRDLIVTTFRDLQITAIKEVFAPPSSGREIVYQGKRQDVIVPTLYSIKIDLNTIFGKLYTLHSKEVDPCHISWLQAEVQNLLASAAQEEARLHPRSTATSFDAWIYPGKRKLLGAGETQVESVFTQAEFELSQHHLQTVRSDRAMSIRRYYQQSFWFKTSRGVFRIRLPRRNDAKQTSKTSDEVGISLQPTVTELPTIDARFVQLKESCLAPKSYGQFNVFLPIDKDVTIREYQGLIWYASVPEIDHALRTGVI